MSKSEPEVITINLEPFMLPLSILLSAIVIAFSIIHAGNTISAGGGIVAGAGAGTVVDGGAAAPQQPVAATIELGDDAYLGNLETAKVAIIEYTDYECPFCQRHHLETMPDIVANFVESGEAIYMIKDYPLSFHDPVATEMAIASECVHNLGGDKQFFDYTDLLFENTGTNGVGVGEGNLVKYAEQVGVNKAEFEKCLDEERFKDEVTADLNDGSAAGISGTPGFIIGTIDGNNVDGEIVSGAQPYSAFEAAIQAQLAR